MGQQPSRVLRDNEMASTHRTLQAAQLHLPNRNQVVQLALVGDCMTGRLLDQVLPHPIPNEVEHGRSISALGDHLRAGLGVRGLSDTNKLERVWGTTLPLFKEADARLINLETSVTTSDTPWPSKVFHYRMHPQNIDLLKVIGCDYASSANNHILDYGYEGMEETMKALREAGIKFAGVGKDANEAFRPVEVPVKGHPISLLVFSFSDHGAGRADKEGLDTWAATEDRKGLNYLDVDDINERQITQLAHKMRDLKRELERERGSGHTVLSVLSIHWGPNYRWHPSHQQTMIAHKLIDEGGVDIVHGHSSHHIQGIELYKARPIIYGAGDFLDDYATDDEYRNDLGMMYFVHLHKDEPTKVSHLTLAPTFVDRMSVNRLLTSDSARRSDYDWLLAKFRELCSRHKTPVYEDPSKSEWHIPVNLEEAKTTTTATTTTTTSEL